MSRLRARVERLERRNPDPPAGPFAGPLSPLTLEAANQAVARLEAKAATGDPAAAARLRRVRELLETAARRRDAAEGKA